MKSLFLFLLRAYKLTISPYLGQNCRFYPSCSAYAEVAICRHGVIRGSLLAGKRLCRCHPWHTGGIDLVPEAEISAGKLCDLASKTGSKLVRATADLNEAVIDQSIVTAKTPASNQPHLTTIDTFGLHL